MPKPKITDTPTTALEDTFFDDLKRSTKGPSPSAEDKVSFTARIPRSLFEALHDLAHAQRRKLGRRVPLSELAAEGLKDLLSKYQG